MNRSWLLLILIFAWVNVFSQTSADIELINQKHDSSHVFAIPKKKYTSLISKKHQGGFYKYNPVTLTFSGLMYMYQNILSSQIYAGCLYHPSCSEFSKNSIREFGLIKGVFLSADRLSRCNRISALEYDLSIQTESRFTDNPHLYRLK